VQRRRFFDNGKSSQNGIEKKERGVNSSGGGSIGRVSTEGIDPKLASNTRGWWKRTKEGEKNRSVTTKWKKREKDGGVSGEM